MASTIPQHASDYPPLPDALIQKCNSGEMKGIPWEGSQKCKPRVLKQHKFEFDGKKYLLLLCEYDTDYSKWQLWLDDADLKIDEDPNSRYFMYPKQPALGRADPVSEWKYEYSLAQVVGYLLRRAFYVQPEADGRGCMWAVYSTGNVHYNERMDGPPRPRAQFISVAPGQSYESAMQQFFSTKDLDDLIESSQDNGTESVKAAAKKAVTELARATCWYISAGPHCVQNNPGAKRVGEYRITVGRANGNTLHMYVHLNRLDAWKDNNRGPKFSFADATGRKTEYFLTMSDVVDARTE